MECPRSAKHEGQVDSRLTPAWGEVGYLGKLRLVSCPFACRAQGWSIIPDSVTLQHELDSMMMKARSEGFSATEYTGRRKRASQEQVETGRP